MFTPETKLPGLHLHPKNQVKGIFYVFSMRSKSLDFDRRNIIIFVKCPRCPSVKGITYNKLYSHGNIAGLYSCYFDKRDLIILK